MNFQQSVKICLTKKKYSAFDGRATRSEYWWFALFQLFVAIVSELLDYTMLDDYANSSGFVSIITTLAFLLPALSVASRRLHDVEKSGWWQWLWIVPVIGWIPLIYWLVQQGSVGENKYGVSSKEGPSIYT